MTTTGAPFETALVFTGLPVDLPGQLPVRFPARMEAIVEDVIKRWVGALAAAVEGSLVGLSRGARGSEVLFLEVCRDLGLETRMVLPEAPDAFVARWVEGASSGDWPDRFLTLWNAHAENEREVAPGHAEARLASLGSGLGRGLRLLCYGEAEPALLRALREAGATDETIDAAALLLRFREAGL